MEPIRALTTIAVVLASACGGSEDLGETAMPRWIPLATGEAERELDRARAAEIFSNADLDIGIRYDQDGAILLEHHLTRPDWRSRKTPSGLREWHASLPRAAKLDGAAVARVELSSPDREYRRLQGRELLPERHPRREVVELGLGHFFTKTAKARTTLVLRLPSDEEPPATATLTAVVPGAGENGASRPQAGHVTTDGFSLMPGESIELATEIPPGCALRLQTLARELVGGGRVTFRVLLDGEPLLDAEQEITPGGTDAHHVLALPADGRGRSRFTFEIDGDPAVAIFADPVIGPAEIGRYGERPWGRGRPDVVLFLADTLRADVLSAYGGREDVTPSLNRLADRSVRMSNARSPSIWTLPSHGSLFTGLLPTQHGAKQTGAALPPELVTIAEHLVEHGGYRTGAATEAGFVSHRFGLDQGFGWFRELRESGAPNLTRTLDDARAFLDRDDGRPVFLFVHTYRTHMPYALGSEEDSARYDRLVARIRATMPEEDRQDHFGGFLGESRDEYHELYLGAAKALDLELGPFFAELEHRGVFANGYFVFTSDHGEEFLEHGSVGHRGAPFEEKIRIPLFFFGPGLEPREVDVGVSLIDLPPTLAGLAGVPVLPTWIGRPLFSIERERPLFSYNEDEEEAYLAVVEGSRKILFRAALDVGSEDLLGPEHFAGAYELSIDPSEAASVLDDDVAWPADLSRSIGPVWSSLSVQLGDAKSRELDEEALEQLRVLGYVD